MLNIIRTSSRWELRKAHQCRYKTGNRQGFAPMQEFQERPEKQWVESFSNDKNLEEN